MPLGWMEMETEWLRVMGGSWAVGLWRALVPGATSSLCLGRPTGSLGLQTSCPVSQAQLCPQWVHPPGPLFPSTLHLQLLL